jgi:AcrR family transcriptional regulator
VTGAAEPAGRAGVGGRPSLAPQRREQILDAVEACIVDHGIDGCSFARVAAEAGVRPSIIPHYFGSKEALMSAMVDRVLGRVQAVLDLSLDGLEGSARIDRLLDVLFGGQLAVPEVVVVLDQLAASAHLSAATRLRLLALYEHFERSAVDILEQVYPEADDAQRRSVAYALVCLGDANNTFRAMGFSSRHAEWAKGIAEQLLDTLNRPNGPVGRDLR